MMWLICGLCILNTFFLIAIAGSLAKLLKYTRDESTTPVDASRQETALNINEPFYKVQGTELVEVKETYSKAVLNGEEDPFSDGMTNRPSANKNWDGIPGN